jgi:hypothetical protein
MILLQSDLITKTMKIPFKIEVVKVNLLKFTVRIENDPQILRQSTLEM